MWSLHSDGIALVRAVINCTDFSNHIILFSRVSQSQPFFNQAWLQLLTLSKHLLSLLVLIISLWESSAFYRIIKSALINEARSHDSEYRGTISKKNPVAFHHTCNLSSENWWGFLWSKQTLKKKVTWVKYCLFSVQDYVSLQDWLEEVEYHKNAQLVYYCIVFIYFPKSLTHNSVQYIH